MKLNFTGWRLNRWPNVQLGEDALSESSWRKTLRSNLTPAGSTHATGGSDLALGLDA